MTEYNAMHTKNQIKTKFGLEKCKFIPYAP